MTVVSLLREVSGRVPDESVDWDAFHARLSTRAELSLARLRHPQPAVSLTTTRVHVFPRRMRPQRPPTWWQHAARWSPAVVTGALAASVVLVVAIRTMPKESTSPSSGVVVTTAGDVDRSRAEFESVVVGHTSASTIASTLLPSAAELLIPLGAEGGGR
jgi:hypothetical protein